MLFRSRLEIGDDLSGCNSQIGGLVGYAGDGVILDGTQVVITDDAQLIGGRHSNIGGIAGGFDSGSDHANELKGNLNATLSGSAVISAESDAAFGSGSVGIGFASITSHANQMVTHPNAKFNISMLGTSVLKVTGDQFGRIGGLVGTFDGYSNGTSATPFGVGSTASPFVTINIGDGAGSAPIIRGIGDSEYIGGGTGVLNNVQVAGEWLVKVHSGAKILSSTFMITSGM